MIVYVYWYAIQSESLPCVRPKNRPEHGPFDPVFNVPNILASLVDSLKLTISLGGLDVSFDLSFSMRAFWFYNSFKESWNFYGKSPASGSADPTVKSSIPVNV